MTVKRAGFDLTEVLSLAGCEVVELPREQFREGCMSREPEGGQTQSSLGLDGESQQAVLQRCGYKRRLCNRRTPGIASKGR